jgi:DNA-binding IclR family transcriptional regulator
MMTAGRIVQSAVPVPDRSRVATVCNNEFLFVNWNPMQAEDTTGDFVKSADRTLDVLELLANWGRQLSHTDIAGALDIPKSSLTKLLKNLAARDYIEYVPETKDYRLGNAILKLANQLGQVRNLANLAQPILEQITEQTKESCALNQLKGDQVEIMATVISKHRLVTHLQLGDLSPLYAVSGGKAILAFLPDAMRREYLQSVQFERFTTRTINSKKALAAELQEIRESGFAVSNEEFTQGIVGVAVPVLSGVGFPLGSLNIAVPVVRFNAGVQKNAVATLKDAAERLRRKQAP